MISEIGKIIGVQGAALHQIRMNSKVRSLVVEKEPKEYDGAFLRKIVITGGLQAIQSAFLLILQQLENSNTFASSQSHQQQTQTALDGSKANANNVLSLSKANITNIKNNHVTSNNNMNSIANNNNRYNIEQYTDIDELNNDTSLFDTYTVTTSQHESLPLPSLVSHGVTAETVRQLMEMREYLKNYFNLDLHITRDVPPAAEQPAVDATNRANSNKHKSHNNVDNTNSTSGGRLVDTTLTGINHQTIGSNSANTNTSAHQPLLDCKAAIQLLVSDILKAQRVERDNEREALNTEDDAEQDIPNEILGSILDDVVDFNSDELLKSVCKAWEDVRHEKITFIAVSAVTVVAIKQSSALVSEFQLHYPALKSIEDICNSGVFQWLPTSAFENSERISQNNFLKPYTEGALLADFKNIGQILSSFTSAIPHDPLRQLTMKQEVFGPPINENYNPVQEVNNMQALLFQELTVLYNNFVVVRAQSPQSDTLYENSKVWGFLMTQFETYFKTQEVSFSLVFSVACWMKSFLILQGDRHVTPRDLAVKEPVLTKMARDLVDHIDVFLHHDRMMHKNPLMTGVLLLECSLCHMYISCQAVHVSANQFRCVMHLYNALVKSDLMAAGSIPLLDSLYPAYEGMLFKPSRDSAVPGEFVKNYLLAGQLTIDTVQLILSGNAKSLKSKRSNEKVSRQQRLARCVNGEDFSDLYRILILDDLSQVCGGGASSSADVLTRVAQVAASEQMDSPRVLGLCLLSVCDSFVPLLNNLFAKYPQVSNGIVLSAECPDLNVAFVAKVLTMLDATVGESREVGLAKAVTSQILDKKFTFTMTIHYNTFTAKNVMYFLPLRADMITSAYGSVSFGSTNGAAAKDIDSYTFGSHMDVMEEHESAGTTVTDAQITKLREDLKKHPIAGRLIDQTTGLGILHYCVWSPVIKNSQRAQLVEFMLHMGMNERYMDVDYRQVTPLHLCAEHGKYNSLCILLSYSEYRDINFVTPSGETCLSLASRGGHYDIIVYLVEHGGSVLRKDCRSTLLSQCASLSAQEEVTRTQELLQRAAMFESFTLPQTGPFIADRSAQYEQQRQARQEMTNQQVVDAMRQQQESATSSSSGK
eukprot:gene21435-27466_t